MDVIYMAHPVGTDPEVRSGNIERAKRWLRWLIARYPEAAVLAPWLPYVEVLDESHRDRAIRDDLRVLAKCATHVALVGGTVSPGMGLEREVGRAIGAEVLDYTYLGPEPPAMPTEDELADLAARKRKPRKSKGADA